MKKEKEKIKKPWYKRKLIWAIIIIVFIMAIGSNGESTSAENIKQNTAAADTQQQPNTESADTTKDEDTAQAAVSEVLRNRKKSRCRCRRQTSAIDGIKFTVSDVRNDKTGNWRISLIAENIEMQNCALDYYKHYFKDDKEIHAIVNFNYNTTTKISVVGNKLDVSVFEYVKKEEHDANLLFSGQLLKEYLVDKETGAVEEVK